MIVRHRQQLSFVVIHLMYVTNPHFLLVQFNQVFDYKLFSTYKVISNNARCVELVEYELHTIDGVNPWLHHMIELLRHALY